MENQGKKYEVQTGEYPCKLDAKGRLMVPADLQKLLGNSLDPGFVLRPGLYSNCIELHLIEDWLVIQQKLKGLSQFVKANIDLMRKFNAGARLVNLDASGRFLIPKHLVDKVGLKKDLIISFMQLHLEVWNEDEYYAKLEEIAPEKYQEMFEEKLGDKNYNQ